MRKKRKQNKLKKTNKKYVIENTNVLILLVILAGLIGYYAIVNPTLNYLDKQRFVRAEGFIDEQIDENIRPVQKSFRTETDNSCYYTSVKMGTGTLICNVDKLMYFESDDREDLTKVIEEVAESFGENFRFSHEGKVESIAELAEVDDPPDVSHVIGNNMKDFGCSTSYSLTYEVNSKATLEIWIGCSDTARTEHFSVVK